MGLVSAFMDGTWTAAFARLGVRRPWTVLLLVLLLATAGVLGTSQLQLDPDLKALLPQDNPAVQRLERVSEVMGTQSDLNICIESPDREANIAFGAALAERLRQMPDLRYVQFRREMDYLRDRALLFVPIDELLEMRRDVKERIRKETEKELIVEVDDSPVASAPAASAKDGDPEPEDPLDVDPDEMITKYMGGGQVPGEYLEADEGRIIVVKARPTRQTTEVVFTRDLVLGVKALIAELDPRSFHPEMTAEIVGEYASTAKDRSGMQKDVLSTAAFAVLGLFALLFAYYRRLVALPVVLLPVVVATLLTLAAGWVIYGTFNLITTFIFAILLGLGIDFAIHCLTRYSFERDRGVPVDEALHISLVSTGNAVVMGATTTMAVFGFLALGHFRGFSQFGIMAAIGVLMALLTTFLVFPALVVLGERLRPWRARPRPPIQVDERAPPRWTTALALLIVLVSFGVGGYSLSHAGDIGFEYDFGKLGARKSASPSEGPPKKDYSDAVGPVTTFRPAVALCSSAEQCHELSRFIDVIRRMGDEDVVRLHAPVEAPTQLAPPAELVDEDDPFAAPEPDAFAEVEAALAGGRLLPEELERVARVEPHRLAELRYFLQAWMSLYTFLPDHQDIKLAIIRDIRERVDRKRASLEPDTQKKVDKLYKYLEVQSPVVLEEIPAWVLDPLREVDGQLGRFVVLWNRGAKDDYADAKRLYDAFGTLPTSTGDVEVAANYFVLVEVVDTLRSDAPVVLSASVIGVLLIVLVFFRSVRATVAVMLPLMLAVSWLAGLFLLTDLKVNMFSVITFPLVIGMGVDDGIHIVHRWRELPALGTVLRETGGPVAMTTVTTCIGFCGLLFANHVGIQTLGFTGASGIALCLVGSLVTLPALLHLTRRSPWRVS